MATRRVSLTVLFLASMCLAPVQIVGAGEDDAQKLPPGTLSGRIVDPNCKAVAGARVWIWDSKSQVEARSGADGRFRLGPVEPLYRNRYLILIEADGFARQYIGRGTYSIFPGADADLGEIRLARGRVFTGQVIDVDGRPYRNADVTAKVYFRELGHTVDHIGPDYHMTTDADGRYRTPPLPVGELGITTQPPNRQNAYVGCAVAPGGEQVLKTLHLEPDVPIEGVLHDDQGRPIAGAEINASVDCRTMSDAQGKFTLHGWGPKPQFQFQMRKDGYVFINWAVKIEDDGVHWSDVQDDKTGGTLPTLDVKMPPESWIEGRAIDAESGAPVRLERTVLCLFQRKPNGEVVLSGCRATRTQTFDDGRFRIPYSFPSAYHITFSARGYHDAEAFTPKITQLQRIADIDVKMTKKREGTLPSVPERIISGRVNRHGKPVTTGWIGLVRRRGDENVVNAYMLRGRTVVSHLYVFDKAPLGDGTYSLHAPFQDDNWYVAVEEPGQSITLMGPLSIKQNEKRQLDIECTDGGSINGSVKYVPAGWERNLWAIAFAKTGIQAEARVNSDATFAFSQLPPGEYGLKVGHDAYLDSEVPGGKMTSWSPSVWELKEDAWQRAKLVTVRPDSETNGVELELPARQGNSGADD
jgi:hypothetical protein